MSRVRRQAFRIAIVTAAVAAVVLGLVGYLWIRPALLTPYSGESTEIMVERGMSMRAVAAELDRREVIPDALVLRLYGRLRQDAAAIQSGRYRVEVGMRPVDVLEAMVEGRVIDDSVRVTIPEGFRLDQIAYRLERNDIVERGAFAEAAVMQDGYRGIDPMFDELADGSSLEGFLFPETYRLFPESEPEAVVRRMLATFARRLDQELRAAVERSERSLREIVILASIVEAESPPEDMPKVAGVFSNRLQRGMRLESDATVNYVLGTSVLQPTFAQVAVDDPYNTYRNPGLPPGPIGNPGLTALRAAADPQETPYYFFLNKPTGETVFSRTFSEHLDNKARYLD